MLLMDVLAKLGALKSLLVRARPPPLPLRAAGAGASSSKNAA